VYFNWGDKIAWISMFKVIDILTHSKQTVGKSDNKSYSFLQNLFHKMFQRISLCPELFDGIYAGRLKVIPSECAVHLNVT